MAKYYVPIEHYTEGWTFLEIEARDAIDAALDARDQVGNRKDVTVWAAVRERPTLDEMVAMRAGFDLTLAGKQKRKRWDARS